MFILFFQVTRKQIQVEATKKGWRCWSKPLPSLENGPTSSPFDAAAQTVDHPMFIFPTDLPFSDMTPTYDF